MNPDFQHLSEDDLSAVMSLAGPLYAESRSIEKSIIDNPNVDGRVDDGSMKIKRGLEQVERLVQVSKYQNNPPPPPQPLPIPFPVQHPYVNTQIPGYSTVISNSHPSPDSQSTEGQMEFNFNSKGLDITNDTLKEISTKLSKILKLLENNVKA